MGAPVRRSVILRVGDQASPLQRLMGTASGGGGGRGGRTRLALMLSLWWVNSRPDYSSDRPASWWAGLIALPDAGGSRTVNANFHELARRGFILLEPGHPGMPNKVTLLDENGNGEPYRRPDGSDGPFFRVPEQLWTTGTIGRLSGPGLVMYLMMLYYHRRSDEPWRSGKPPPPRPVWFTANSFRERHGFSEDTRLQGILDLQDAGIISVRTVSIDPAGTTGHRRHQRRLLTLNPQFEPPLPAEPPSTNRTPSLPELGD